MLAHVRLRLLVHRVVVSDERGLLAGAVVAKVASERLVVQVDHLVVNFEGLVGLELLAASLADVNLERSIASRC